MASKSAAAKAARLNRRMAALAAREGMSPTARAPERFRLATWNINSLRARAVSVDRFLERARPDVICLQETKASTIAPDAASVLQHHGYNVAYTGNGAYNGVAIAALLPLTGVQVSGDFGSEHLDREPRLITGLVRTSEPIRIVSVYVPHGREVDHWHYEYKLGFLDQLAVLVRSWLTESALIVAGDINVAPTDSDIFHPDAFVGLTHVTPRERAAWQAVLDAGLVDVDAKRWGPDKRRFTWWNHGLNYGRNLGMRIDMIAASHQLAERIDATWIDHIERGTERPSDHACLVADFHVA
jgi:exodeoxyribonuclease III